MNILILNGPNLNLLGTREPNIYGARSFEAYFNELSQNFPKASLTFKQSNHEGELIDILHQSDSKSDGIILNAGAYTHTSIALADAIEAIVTPVVEVHVSNVYGRERYRRHSYLSKHCKGIITGFGLNGYALAIRSFLNEN